MQLGKVHTDEIILSPEETKKMANFLNRNLNRDLREIEINKWAELQGKIIADRRDTIVSEELNEDKINFNLKRKLTEKEMDNFDSFMKPN